MRDDLGQEVEGLTKEELEEIATPREVRESKPRGEYQIKEWKPLYTKILVMVQKGMRPEQIAREEGISFSYRTIYRIIKSPLFRMKMLSYNEKMDTAIIERAADDISKVPEVVLAKDKLAGSAEKAADILIGLMNPKSHLYKDYSIHDRRLMLTAAQDVLDRAGLKNVVAQEDPNRGREYSPEEVKSALENARELEGITNRLGTTQSGFVLSHEQRTGAEALGTSDGGDERDALAPTMAVEPEGLPLETPADPQFHTEENEETQ